MVSGTRCPYVSACGCEVVRGAAAPKGPMTYAVFIALRGYRPCAAIWASRLEFGLQGWVLGLEVGV